MAKFIPGPLLSEIRNALGAQVFSRNQFGAYTRARVNPDNTETPDRLTAKEALQSSAIAWGTTLTDAQRLAWNAFADALLVRTRSPLKGSNTGVSLFVKLWVLAYWWSGNFLTDPPQDLDTPELTSAVLTSDGVLSELIITFTPTPVPAGQIVMVYATESLNQGVTRPHRWFKPIAMFTAGMTSPQNIWTDYEAAHGQPVDAKKIFTRCKIAYTTNNFPSVPVQSVTLISGVPDAMLQATVTLTDAQIKALPTTPITIVAAQAGKILVLHTLSAQLKATAGAYGNVSAGTGDVVYATVGTTKTITTRNNLLFAGALNRTTILPPRALLDAIPPTVQQLFVPVDDPAVLTNVPIQFACTNAAGNFTGGNAANVLQVDAFYSVENAA